MKGSIYTLELKRCSRKKMFNFFWLEAGSDEDEEAHSDENSNCALEFQFASYNKY
jgi:hypothetical protein